MEQWYDHPSFLAFLEEARVPVERRLAEAGVGEAREEDLEGLDGGVDAVDISSSTGLLTIECLHPQLCVIRNMYMTLFRDT